LFNKQKFPKLVYAALLSGLVLKLFYLFVIGPKYIGDTLLMSNDSFSYTNSFFNLVNKGVYTHDISNPEAYYGRLPGVAFLWGLFYLLFGFTKAHLTFAIFQILLDALATVMVFRIISKYFNETVAVMVSFVYALFPLTFYFVVKTDTEYISLFFVILVFYQLVFFKPELKRCFLLGLTLVGGFYIRETLLLLIPLAFFYLYRNHKVSWKNYNVIFLVMLLLYLPWPARNYIRSSQIILIKPLSAGYREYNKDIVSYMYWLYAILNTRTIITLN
jgi:hypothetical protein